MSRIHHSFCRWCYQSTPLEDLCLAAKDIGIPSIELVMPDDLPLLAKHGLTCAMISFPVGKTPEGTEVGRIEKAFNRLEHHDTLVEIYEPHLKTAAAAGAKNVIVFSGNREGISDEEGLQNCATGLRRLLPLAEELGITLVMELLNSKIDHPDYQCDHTAWGVAVCKAVASPRVKLLYDIYHMQIMEGDVIRTIRDNIQYIGHFHTGGVPGRHEIDDESQELHWRTIAQAIADLKFEGYFAHEFVPVKDPMTSLKEAITLCTV